MQGANPLARLSLYRLVLSSVWGLGIIYVAYSGFHLCLLKISDCRFQSEKILVPDFSAPLSTLRLRVEISEAYRVANAEAVSTPRRRENLKSEIHNLKWPELPLPLPT